MADRHSWSKHLLNYYNLPTLSSIRQKNKTEFKASCKQHNKILSFSIFLFISIICTSAYITHQIHSNLAFNHSQNQRVLLGDDDCYPKAAGWLAILCFFGTLYMFIALAIVCDEFFVPSLEVITLRIKISNDVAGATLMAAGIYLYTTKYPNTHILKSGGSAPELFTSLIGTFQESDIGFAAIVGSAVFNVLFVVGVCAFVASKPLELTWWPLARDCVYYAIGLIVLAIFFIVTSENEIDWFEALILFSLYIGYIILMKYNQKIYQMIEDKRKQYNKSLESSYVLSHSDRRNTMAALEDLKENMDKEMVQNVCVNERDFHKTTFRAGMLNILLKDDWNWNDSASITVITGITGDVHETFEKLDKDHNGFLEMNELEPILEDLNADMTRSSLPDLMKELDTNKDGRLSYAEFSRWYIQSEERILGEMHYLFKQLDVDKSNTLTVSEIHAFLTTVGVSDISRKDIQNIFGEYKIDYDKQEGMNFEQFKTWFLATKYYQEKLECFSQQSKKIESIDNDEILSFPKTFGARFFYILSIPLILLFLCTIPDTRKPGKAKWCFFSFFMSIIWIGVFSYFLVTWTEIIGDTLHIPTVVMGLTFLAAGTSIPDLLSSVIVTKQGHGDMAVSSSIGSNIFDILVGLPIPWLAYSAYYGGKAVTVGAEGLSRSILILLGMLVLIVVIIKMAGWKMTKKLGVAWLVLYVVFVAQDLAFQDWGC